MANHDEAQLVAAAAGKSGDDRIDADHPMSGDREHNPETRAAEPPGFARELRTMLANLARLI